MRKADLGIEVGLPGIKKKILKKKGGARLD